jgi:hypothetical protein
MGEGQDTVNVQITVIKNVGFPNLTATESDFTYHFISINFFPNPARNDINIELPEHIYQAIFTFYDTQRKVYKKRNQQEIYAINS